MSAPQGWQEDTSALYRRLAQIAVPDRAVQIATLLCLIPFSESDSPRVVELASGEGYLSHAIADAFPQATILALDYEQSMREATAQRLGSRGELASFDIRATDWFKYLDGADVVVSSLCVHHLDGDEKQRLFREAAARINMGGTLLIADLIAPQTSQANRLFATTWDAKAESASMAQTGSLDLFENFRREQWNLFRYPDPDFDKPSPLFAQLKWLESAGFNPVDCFWMQAGHAIYGGYKESQPQGIDYVRALSIARAVLKA